MGTIQPSATPATELQLSPSVVHDRLMHETPALAYDGGDVKAWQRKLRRKVRQCLGYEHMPKAPGELNIRRLWQREHELGAIEKRVCTSEPGADVPCYRCLPRDVKPPYPVFICVQGHSSGMHNSIGVTFEDEDVPMDEVPGDRDFGLGCMRRGVAALCIEQRAFGEREETVLQDRWDDRCTDAAMHALMLGRTLVGERVYDVQRGIDALRQLNKEKRRFDFKRLGVMGNSGGGTVAMFASAIMRDIRFAIPSCYFCNWRDCIMRLRHCTDNYVPGMLAHAEAADVMGLFAPRPLVIVAGEQDEIFPIHGVKDAFESLKRIYRAAGAENNCKLVIGAEGHRFYAEPAWDAMQPMLNIKQRNPVAILE